MRPLLFTLGVLSFILGLIGVFVPLLPTTPFILLAAWCFLRSSPRAHAWLYRQPLFGKTLRDWEEHRVISPKAKLSALLAIFISVIGIWIKVQNLAVAYSVTALLLAVSIFIATRKSRR